MYDIDTSRIERQLSKLDQCVEVIRQINETGQRTNLLVERFAVERSLHIATECITDIGNALIDGFIMRDPGSYADIIDILEDEGVLPTSIAKAVQQLIGYRKKLVYAYEEIEADELAQLIGVGTESLPAIRSHVEGYIKQEMSPWKLKQ